MDSCGDYARLNGMGLVDNNGVSRTCKIVPDGAAEELMDWLWPGKGIIDRADERERSEIRPENSCGSEDRGSHCHGHCGNRQKRSN
jgi:hypothetical protein